MSKLCVSCCVHSLSSASCAGFLPALTNSALLNVWDLEALTSSSSRSSSSSGSAHRAGAFQVSAGSQIAKLRALYSAEPDNGGNHGSGDREYEELVTKEWLRARAASVPAG